MGRVLHIGAFDKFRERVEEILGDFPSHYFSLAFPSLQQENGKFLISSVPQGLVETYARHQHFRCDPRLREGEKTQLPFHRDASKVSDLAPEEKAVYEAQQDFGVGGGLLIPVQLEKDKKAFINFCYREKSSLTPEKEMAILKKSPTLMATYLWQYYKALSRDDQNKLDVLEDRLKKWSEYEDASAREDHDLLADSLFTMSKWLSMNTTGTVDVEAAYQMFGMQQKCLLRALHKKKERERGNP